MNELAKNLAKHFLKQDPEIESRIHEGIETNRKGFGEIKLVDSDGHPVERASVKLVQRRHEYHFGGNLFMLGEFETDDQNIAYENIFKDIFNLGVIPFYWSDLEPQDGVLRFDKHSPSIARRPPPDRCLEFCEANSITPQGHPLLWHGWFPAWLHGTSKEVESRIARHLQEIAARYSHRINRWDVINEAQPGTWEQGPVPDAFIDLAFKLAGQFFPAATLAYLSPYHEETQRFHHMVYSPVYLLVRRLLAYGINSIGLQFHLMESGLDHAGRFMSPTHLHYLFKCLDNYARLGLPLDLSEISVSFKREVEGGEELQSLVVEKLYKLWFSHPATHSAIWGNVVDSADQGASTGAEDGGFNLRAGLLNSDFTPKKAFMTLKRLIKEEWTTQAALEYEAGAVNKFRGFFGDYDVLIETATGPHRAQLKLSKGAINQFPLTIGSPRL